MALDEFGSRLRAVRKERGYTQKQLANSLGVTEQAVSKWERETSYPDIMMLNGISEVLECSLDYLFQFEPGKKNLLNQDSVERKAEINRHLLPDIISLTFGEELVPMFVEENKQGFPHVNAFRREIASQWGLILPAIRIMDDFVLEPAEYQICVNGVPVCKETLTSREESGWEMIYAKLKEQIFAHLGQIINNQTIYYMVENLQKKYPYVVEGIVPERISYSLLRQVILCLLTEYRRAVNPLILIIESLEMNLGITDVKELAGKAAERLPRLCNRSE